VSGVAATGAPLSGNIYLKASDGTVLGPLVIQPDGSYSFDVTGLTPPFYLFAEELDVGGIPTGRVLYSISMGPGTSNVNPLTYIALAIAAKVDDPSKAYNNPQGFPVNDTELNDAVANLMAMLSDLLNDSNYNAANINFLTGDVPADGKGMDNVFDDTNFTLLSGKVITELFGKKIGEIDINDWTGDPIQSSEIANLLVQSTDVLVNGFGLNRPFRASLNIQNPIDPSTLTGSLSYSFQRMFVSSTGISSVTSNGNSVEISGTATVFPLDGSVMITDATFLVTISDGAPDAFSIVIKRADDSLYYSTVSDPVVQGNFEIASTISGNGLNEPFLATMTALNIDSAGLTGSVTYSYQGVYLNSISITSVTLLGSQVTISGQAIVSPVDRGTPLPGVYTFTATIIDGVPDAMGIEINNPDDSLHFSTFPKELIQPTDFTVIDNAPI
jgi:hypothetical protein